MLPERRIITIQAGSTGKTRVRATCLGCFAVHRNIIHTTHDGKRSRVTFGERYSITHLPTGLGMTATVGLLPSEAEALQVIREISTLRDWTFHTYEACGTEQERKALGNRVKAVAKMVASPTPSMCHGGAGPATNPAPLNSHALRPCLDAQLTSPHTHN